MKTLSKNKGTAALVREVDLFDAVLALKSREEATAFFADLCSPEELRAMAERWRVVTLLDQDVTYRRIYEITGVSTATVTRVARCLNQPASGYARILARLKKKRSS